MTSLGVQRDAGTLAGKLRVGSHGMVEEGRHGLIMFEAQRANIDINDGFLTVMGSCASYNSEFCRLTSIHPFPSPIITFINVNTWN